MPHSSAMNFLHDPTWPPQGPVVFMTANWVWYPLGEFFAPLLLTALILLERVVA